MGIIINHYKDPYYTTSIVESKRFFSRLNCFLCIAIFKIWQETLKCQERPEHSLFEFISWEWQKMFNCPKNHGISSHLWFGDARPLRKKHILFGRVQWFLGWLKSWSNFFTAAMGPKFCQIRRPFNNWNFPKRPWFLVTLRETNTAGWKMDPDWRCISYYTWGYSSLLC